jgi:hypothetical protein
VGHLSRPLRHLRLSREALLLLLLLLLTLDALDSFRDRCSHFYVEDKWTYVTELPGVAKYAADAYAIYGTEDRKLVDYWNAIYGTGRAAASSTAWCQEEEDDSWTERIDYFSD